MKPQLESDRPHRHPHCSLTHCRGDWVKLLRGPHGTSARQAQLLFSESLTTWIAKIPDHGEVVLDRSQFYC
ncbi:MAG: hypothetical protein F6K00_19910 [Leptolyngbya sp. SIOISBB]|nr:hypothetical protein [Leptolyngbya sp. SIOISBB]